MNRLLGLALAGLAFGLIAVARAEDKKGTVVELGDLKSAAPGDWQEVENKSRFRLKQFRIPKVGDDAEDTELIIFHFPGQGGSVDANVKRWKGMFIPPKGKTSDEASTVEKLMVGDVTATVVDVSGTYKFKPTPMTPDEQAQLKPDYRMLSVYFDSKGGPYFFRLVGPAKTVEKNKKAFEDWVKGFK